MQLLGFPQGQNDHECFEPTQDIESGMTEQLETLTKEDFQTASRSGKNGGINV